MARRTRHPEEEADDDFKVDFGDIVIPDVNLAALGFDDDEEGDPTPAMETRYMAPKPPVKGMPVLYDHAKDLARDIRVADGERYNVIVSGNFVFGDFLHAYLTQHHIRAERMTITTLSLSARNIDSLKRLMDNGYILQLDMVLSIYFYGHERWQLIPHLYKSLDKDNKFQLAIAGIHTKIVFFETNEGQKIVIHGSANLRSSVNVEQFTIEENPELYDFYAEVFGKVMERYGTIKKPILCNDLWKVMTTKKFN
jgi:hypothetical protein